MSLTELDDAITRLNRADAEMGGIPTPIKKMLHDMLIERDHASARIARSLREMVKL